MGDILQPTHLLFVLVVALLVLGPKRLPEVGKALGRGLRDFRSAMSGEAISGEERRDSSISTASEPVPSSATIHESAQATIVHDPPQTPPAVEEATPVDPAQPSESSSGSTPADAPAPRAETIESVETVGSAPSTESAS